MADIYDIAASGMAAQRIQMDLIGENLANAGVVRADGGVFAPKTAVLESGAPFASVLQDAMHDDDMNGFFAFGGGGEPASGAVSVARIVEHSGSTVYRLDPGNPFAQRDGPHKGYVALPDVDPIQEMVELVASGRAYDADVSMLQAAKQMDLEAADITRA